MIKTSTIHNVLNAALESGADFAELFVEDKDALSLSMIDGKVENIVALREYGAGVRIFLGTRSIYAYSNDTSETALIATARQAASALGESKNRNALDISLAEAHFKQNSPILQRLGDVSHAQKIYLLKKAHTAAKNDSPEITQVSVTHSDVERKILVANTEGVFANSTQVRTRFAVQAVASNATEHQTGFEAPGHSMGFEVYQKRIDVEEVARIATQQAVTMLHAQECPGGIVPVVIDGGFGGVIFHEACGHSLEATAVAMGESIFCGKLGQQIAAPCVDAFDDGTLANEWGTLDIDDEGRPTQRNVLIEKGILRGYLIDKMGARRMNMSETGSSRRESYKYAPTSRMNNTFIGAGTDDDDEILRSMGEGLYAKTMGGGSVNPLTGEFNFSVREGYWVKNGVLTPVRGATLIGKGADVIMNIDRVGKKITLGTGMCGSVSGSVPTCVGQPRIRVSALSVGGKGEMK